MFDTASERVVNTLPPLMLIATSRLHGFFGKETGDKWETFDVWMGGKEIKLFFVVEFFLIYGTIWLPGGHIVTVYGNRLGHGCLAL